jgi:hypothetical protein
MVNENNTHKILKRNQNRETPKRTEETAEFVRYRFKRNERTYDFKIIYDEKHQEATLVEAQISQREVENTTLIQRLGSPMVQEYVHKALIEKGLIQFSDKPNIKVIV